MAVQVLKNKVAQCVSYWWTQVTFEQTTSTAILPLLMAPVHCPAEKRYEVEGETIYCFPGSVCQCQLADKKRSVVVRAYASLGAQHYLEIGCQCHECRHQAVGVSSWDNAQMRHNETHNRLYAGKGWGRRWDLGPDEASESVCKGTKYPLMNDWHHQCAARLR